MAAAASRITLKVPIRLICDDAREIGKRHRPVAADDALGRADAGAIDQDAGDAVLGLSPRRWPSRLRRRR